MKKFLAGIALFLSITACGSNPPITPVEQPGIETIVATTITSLTANAPAATEPPATPDGEQLTPNGNPVNTAEISFLIPNGIANDASSIMTTEVEYPYINPSAGDMPQHLKLTLNAYGLNGTLLQPQIMVFRASEYSQYSDMTAEILSTLQSLQYIDGQPLPENLNGPMFTAQIRGLNFQNGHGIRHLTQVAQAVVPVNNREIFYYFQGMTNDNQYYIQAVLPISAPFLPADAGFDVSTPADGIPFNENDFPAYINAITEKLNNSDPFSFTPYLEHLDAMIESMQVTGF
jgi:hypothetical protein